MNFSVEKRDKTYQDIDMQKIMIRVKTFAKQYNIIVPLVEVVEKVMDQLYDKIPTEKIDQLLAEQLIAIASVNQDYNKLATAVLVSNHQKLTSNLFSEVIKNLDNESIIHNNLLAITNKYSKRIDNYIDYQRDYLLDYFGVKTLERAYLLRINDKIVERPQHMWMRVALSIHYDNIELAFETYDLMSKLHFTHATPTLFNAGTKKQQLSSCYLVAMQDDSITGIFKTLSQCAEISKWAGGIGIHCSNIRVKNSKINGTNGKSNGIVPMLKVFNETARYVDQGGGKRNGSIAFYQECWQDDIFDFLDCKKNHGDENARARDLFYALWVDDEFMRRVESNEKWYLCCPNSCPGLNEVYGEEFVELYNQYIKEKRYNRVIDARQLWFAILDSQMETGTPYILYKDAANKKSNQQNLGTIKSSNLCTEIIEYSSPEETAVCNLASIALSKCVVNKIFDYDYLYKITKIVTKNLNRVIDLNFYPTKESERSNMLHRPIGIGVQGLADCFALLDVSFDSNDAREINKQIFETIYFAAMEASYELAEERLDSMKQLRELIDNDKISFNGYDKISRLDNNNPLVAKCNPIYHEVTNLDERHLGAYSTFKGSPLSKGKFQFDLWNKKPTDRYDWDDLRRKIMETGVRNSLLVAPMPTASTSQILGNNEAIEPFTSNIYTRRTLAGEFVVVNKFLQKELVELGIWSKELKDNIIENRGSIQHITNIDDKIKEKYKISWELSMKALINMAADRGQYVCQSQSMNLWIEDPDYGKLTAMHFYSWKLGLKTGIYYLRRKPKYNAQQFTIVPKEECLMCGS